MRLVAKTCGWIIVSATIYFICAVLGDCPWQTALLAATLAALTKLPAYPVWELAFAWLWVEADEPEPEVYAG